MIGALHTDSIDNFLKHTAEIYRKNTDDTLSVLKLIRRLEEKRKLY